MGRLSLWLFIFVENLCCYSFPKNSRQFEDWIMHIFLIPNCDFTDLNEACEAIDRYKKNVALTQTEQYPNLALWLKKLIAREPINEGSALQRCFQYKIIFELLCYHGHCELGEYFQHCYFCNISMVISVFSALLFLYFQHCYFCIFSIVIFCATESMDSNSVKPGSWKGR